MMACQIGVAHFLNKVARKRNTVVVTNTVICMVRVLGDSSGYRRVLIYGTGTNTELAKAIPRLMLGDVIRVRTL